MGRWYSMAKRLITMAVIGTEEDDDDNETLTLSDHKNVND